MSKCNYVISAILLFSIIIFFFFFNYTQDLHKRLNTTENELLGLEKLESFNTLNNALQRYRGFYAIHPESNLDVEHVNQERLELQYIINTQLERINVPRLTKEIQLILSKESKLSRSIFRELTQIIIELNKQINHIADKYELLYEPERENYLLMEIIVYKV
ncbi:MAG: hypothetical protein KAQ91_11030, partial [Methylococcales bacterium]|nr:hypothetical protein [Methylococcales bacterium]